MNEQYNEETAPAQNLGLVQLENEALVSRVAKLQEEKWQVQKTRERVFKICRNYFNLDGRKVDYVGAVWS